MAFYYKDPNLEVLSWVIAILLLGWAGVGVYFIAQDMTYYFITWMVSATFTSVLWVLLIQYLEYKMEQDEE